MIYVYMYVSTFVVIYLRLSVCTHIDCVDVILVEGWMLGFRYIPSPIHLGITHDGTNTTNTSATEHYHSSHYNSILNDYPGFDVSNH